MWCLSEKICLKRYEKVKKCCLVRESDNKSRDQTQGQVTMSEAEMTEKTTKEMNSKWLRMANFGPSLDLTLSVQMANTRKDKYQTFQETT